MRPKLDKREQAMAFEVVAGDLQDQLLFKRLFDFDATID